MRNSSFRKILFIFWFVFIAYSCMAQDTGGIQLEANSEINAGKTDLLDVTLSVKNTESKVFSGKILISVPQGMRSISGTSIDVELKPGEQQFIPVKIWIQKEAEAGMNTLSFSIVNGRNEVVSRQNMERQVEENNQLKMYTDLSMIYLSNPNDSLRIKTQVSNLGNRSQDVTLVVKIPELVGETNFFELKGNIQVQRDSTFVFTFMPNRRLLQLQQFNIQITGLRGAEKELFGNLNIVVQNVASSQQFVHSQNTVWSNFRQKNTMTASYRQIGEDTGIAQLQGAADIDLPAGYLSLRGIAYKSSNQNQYVLNNTSLSYTLNNNQLVVGNLSKPFEMSLLGRGMSILTGDDRKDKSVEVGFIDQQFNLIQQNGFLKNGYGFYAHGILGGSNYAKNFAGTYLFREDPFESAKHQMVSGEMTREFTTKWRLNTKIHGALSSYDGLSSNKASYAVETQYNGVLGAYKLFGNYFVSSSFFPGNRRGVTQLQQSINREIGETGSLTASYFYSRFAPKSPVYFMQSKSASSRAEFMYRWKPFQELGMGIGYQFQNEASSNYNGIVGLDASYLPKLYAHRLTEHFNWASPNQLHFIHLEFENGLARYPLQKKMAFQGKAQANYSYKAFNSSISYQKGSYYLSEYLSYYRTSPDNSFYRLMASASFQKQFFAEKLMLNSGVSYMDDPMIGSTPSLFFNTSYSPNQTWQCYLNTSWYKYDTDRTLAYAYPSHLLTIEAGIRFNFDRRTPSAGKKSRVSARVFYDKNANSIWDEGDELATDYMTILNNTSFKTDDKGQLFYQSVPFGDYTIQTPVQKGWYPAVNAFNVSDYRTSIDIPLHQNGSVNGSVTYEYDEKRVLDFEPKLGGLVLNILQNGKVIQKVATTDEGHFTAFLPTGIYQVVLAETSLAENTFCENTVSEVRVESGKMTRLPAFIIQVRQKTIQIKRFGS